MNEKYPYPPSRKALLGVALLVLLFTACGTQPEPPATPTVTPTATLTPPPTLTPTPTVVPGPFENQPAIPYPSDEMVQELGITDYQVVGDQFVALDGKGYIVVQATTNEKGEFTQWQRTVPLAVETNLVVPHPQETNPELFNLRSDAPIPQFVNAMRAAGLDISIESVNSGLRFQLETPQGRPEFITLRTSDGYVLLIARKNDNNELRWEVATPGNYWGALGKHIGPSMNGNEWQYGNNRELVSKYFSDGGILGLLGQVRPGPDIEERRPARAAEYLRFAKQKNMAFMFNYVVEPGKFPKSTDVNNIDQWLERRLSEIADVIIQNKPNQPVYIQFNEATRDGNGWNTDKNPIKDKYGDQWFGEYVYKALSIFINKGLVPNQDFFLLTNENNMLSQSSQWFVHNMLEDARRFAFEKLNGDPNMAGKLRGIGIETADDIKIVLGSQTYVNLDGKPRGRIVFIKNPNIDELKIFADKFKDTGGVIFTEVGLFGTPEQKASFLEKLTFAVLNTNNFRGVLLWNIFNNPEDNSGDIYMTSPTLLFNEDGTPTRLYYELLR